MTIQGETISDSNIEVCADCQISLALQVLQSAAGYYIGTWCDCGPYSRESGYYPTREEATEALNNNNFGR